MAGNQDDSVAMEALRIGSKARELRKKALHLARYDRQDWPL